MTTEQLLTAATNLTKNSAEALTALSMARLDALQKLADLNLQTMRKALEQTASVSRELLSSDHPQDGFAPSLQAFQSNSQKLMSDYFSQTAKIAAESQQELVEAMQRQVDKAQQQFKPMLELNTPRLSSGNGMQPVSTWFDQMLSNANQFYGTLQQLSKTAAETTQDSLRSLDGAAARAASSKPAGGRRAAAA
ncbi:phasin family protein [Thiomonas sp.]